MGIRSWTLAVVLVGICGGTCDAQSVVTYHNSLTRHGAYVVPGLTLSAAANMQLDGKFRPKLDGHIYAQPLYWLPTGSKDGELIVATESNHVYALSAKTGKTIWDTKLKAS